MAASISPLRPSKTVTVGRHMTCLFLKAVYVLLIICYEEGKYCTGTKPLKMSWIWDGLRFDSDVRSIVCHGTQSREETEERKEFEGRRGERER